MQNPGIGHVILGEGFPYTDATGKTDTVFCFGENSDALSIHKFHSRGQYSISKMWLRETLDKYHMILSLKIIFLIKSQYVKITIRLIVQLL